MAFARPAESALYNIHNETHRAPGLRGVLAGARELYGTCCPGASLSQSRWRRRSGTEISQDTVRAELLPAAQCLTVLTDARCGGCVRRDAAGEVCGASEGWRWVLTRRPGRQRATKRRCANSSEETARAGTQRTGTCENELTDADCGVGARQGDLREVCARRRFVSRGESVVGRRAATGSSARVAALRGAPSLSTAHFSRTSPPTSSSPESIKECGCPTAGVGLF